MESILVFLQVKRAAYTPSSANHTCSLYLAWFGIPLSLWDLLCFLQKKKKTASRSPQILPTVSSTFLHLHSCHTGARNLGRKANQSSCIAFVIQLISLSPSLTIFSPLSFFSPSSVLSSWGLDLRGVPGKERARELLFNQGIRVCVCVCM